MSCIEEYIRDSYKQSEVYKRGEPLIIRGSYSTRDIVLAMLCGKAIGKDNVRINFHKRPDGKDSLAYLNFDFDEIQVFEYFVKEIILSYEFIDDASIIVKQTWINYLLSETTHMNYKSLTRALRFIDDIIFIEMHPERLTLSSFNFGDCLFYNNMLNHIYQKTTDKELKRDYFHKMHDILLPFYLLTDEEVGLIGMYLGISNLYYNLFSSDYFPSFNYRDTPIERAVKIASSVRINLNKLDNNYLLNIAMNCVPQYTDNLDSLTYFFMGECYGCYE